MNGDRLVGDGAEILLAVAVGGMWWSALTRLRRGQARPRLCPGCSRTVSRAYVQCPYCGDPLQGPSTG